MKRILLGAATFTLLALAPATFARAETPELEIIFFEVDLDGNQGLSLSEVLATAMEQFNQTDSDKDSKLEKEEVGDLATNPEFSDNDTNKDGALSIEEVITEKIADFKASDANNDGSLSLDEVKKTYESSK